MDRHRLRATLYPTLGGATAMTFVGGSAAVSGVLADGPMWTAQAVRYAAACLLLIGFARSRGVIVMRPRGSEWAWLSGVALTGLVIFNLALMIGAKHAEPAVLGVAIACVPIVLAVLGPLLDGARPASSAVVAGLVVTVGAGAVEGLGHADLLGVGCAVVVFACECAFTLLAVPPLRRHGPVGVSVHTTWIAAAGFAVVAVGTEGLGAVAGLSASMWWAIAFLAVGVTAAAFVLWYGCVAALGAGRAGVLTGIAPVAAALVGVAVGASLPGPGVWAGIAIVAAGIALGLRTTQTLVSRVPLDAQ